MACACVQSGQSKCMWCKEAEKKGNPPSNHGCQWAVHGKRCS